MEVKRGKEKIVAAAFELFVAEGYRVGINRIVERAGVSRGALYHYFSSKENLFEEVVETYLFKHFHDLPDIVSGPGSFQTKIQHMMDMWLSPFYAIDQYTDGHTGSGYLTILSAIRQNKHLLQLQQEYNRRWVEALKSVTKQGFSEGQLHSRKAITGLVDAIRLIVDGALLNAYNTSLEEARHTLQRSVSYLLSSA
jgi:AcrR family transcriptional regulator